MSFCDAFVNIIKHGRFYIVDNGKKHDELFFNISRNQWPGWPGWALIDAAKIEFCDDLDKIVGKLADDESMIGHLKEFFISNIWLQLAQLTLFDRTTGKLFDIAAQFGITIAISLYGSDTSSPRHIRYNMAVT